MRVVIHSSGPALNSGYDRYDDLLQLWFLPCKLFYQVWLHACCATSCAPAVSICGIILTGHHICGFRRGHLCARE